MIDPLMPFGRRPAAPPPLTPETDDDTAADRARDDDSEIRARPNAHVPKKDPEILRQFAPLFRSDSDPAGKGRLPASWRGDFEAAPGDSRFMPHDPGYFGLAAGQGIAYVHGVPDYKQGDLVARLPSGRPGVVQIPGLDGAFGENDFDQAVRHLALAEEMSEPEMRQWLVDNDIKLHHFGGSEVQAVNGRLHRAHRWGGAHQQHAWWSRPEGYDWRPDDS
jgi:hypothetical protein